MPNSPALWFAAVMLWLMDASINISMEPFRAFVGDNLPNSQRTLGFAAQSFFIGIGAVVGSVLPWLLTNVFEISNTAAEGVVPPSVRWSFYIGGAVFLLAVLWTVFHSFEYSPEELEEFEAGEQAKKEGRVSVANKEKTTKNQQITGIIMIVIGLLLTAITYAYGIEKEVYILGVGLAIVGGLFLLAAILRKQNADNAFVTIMTDMQNMPETMKQLAIVQFFSWFALFSMWIYTTQAVTGHVFGETDTTSQAYNNAADWVPVMFAVYNGVAALVAFLLPVIAKKTSNKVTHLLALCIGGIGLISIYFLESKVGLLWSMVGVGVAWASILSIPYAMLSGSLPAAKMGYYMGVFNFFIVIPQIVAATILGFLVKSVFNGQPIFALIIGGIATILAGLFTLRVKTNPAINV